MSLTNSLPIATLPARLENITEMIVGFVFVIVVLALLAGITEAIGFVFKRIAKGKSTQPAPIRQTRQSSANNVSAPATADSAPEEIPPEIIAVIAAAVHMTVKQPHRIVAIQAETHHQWAAEGRREIFQSHRLR